MKGLVIQFFFCLLIGVSVTAEATWSTPDTRTSFNVNERNNQTAYPHFERISKVKKPKKIALVPAKQARSILSSENDTTCQTEVVATGTLPEKITAISLMSKTCIADNMWQDSEFTRSLYTQEFLMALAEQIV
ncbi:hypothetical protein [uncultured Paraglaciecola sp.]|uniref:hypothetical protein n=1 Tax=uncultured Paraglaciecola sp. TaxID=1765024 RepID=UPI0025E0A43A|nr:hypothetical protein [uncultured Paraglaciecola sp.]